MHRFEKCLAKAAINKNQTNNAAKYAKGYVMAAYGQWIANCKKERAERIASASIYILEVGPPVPNQLQTLEKLQADNFIGLYRLEKKETETILREQNNYLHASEFTPSPESLKNLLGSLASLRSR
ncbi:MAG: hypothetical protein LBJ14_11070 [Desulfarculales bacterium]|jgi:hypothetical protein|nr:hypothetical protein [Desulfarculales bacterium]